MNKKISSSINLLFYRSFMCSHPWPVPLTVYRNKIMNAGLRVVGKILGGLILAIALIIILMISLKSAAIVAGILLLWLFEGYVNFMIQSRKVMKIMPSYIEELAKNQEFIDLAIALSPREGKQILYDPNGVNTNSEEFKKLREVKAPIDVLVDNAMVIGALGYLGREIRINFWATREMMKYLKTLGYPPQE